MSKFSVVFITPSENNELKHRIIVAPDQESAMKIFFKEEATMFYSDDNKGYHYFKEDFFHRQDPSGSIICCD
jgi:hypothetical protein